MKYSIKEIADKINAQVVGNSEGTIEAPSTLLDASSCQIASLHNKKYLGQLAETEAGAVIISSVLKPEKEYDHLTFLVVDDAYSAFATILKLFSAINYKSGIAKSAHIGDDCKIDDDCYIGPGVVIGDNCVIGKGCQIHSGSMIGDHVEIGQKTTLHSGVNVYDRSKIGQNCLIHSGVVIGSDGFGFAPNASGEIEKVPQLGYVLIGDEVEIGANTTIDRGTLGPTKIGKGVKLDNLIQIGHNVEIGPYTIIAAQTGISGSTKLGHHCMIGGQVGFVGHINIAPYTMINAKAGVSKNVKKEHQKLHGAPAFAFGDAMKSYVVYKQLPQLKQKVEELEEMLSLQRKKE